MSRYVFSFLCSAALVPGPVRNLRQILDTNQPSLTLNWDEPNNSKLSGEVTAYDVYFRPSRCQSEKAQHETSTTRVNTTQLEPSAPSLWSEDNALTATNSHNALMGTSLATQWGILPASSSSSVFLQQDLSPFCFHSLPLHSPESTSEIQLQSAIVSEADSNRKTLDVPPTGTLLAKKPQVVCDFDLIPTSLPPVGEPLLLPPSSPVEPYHPHPILTPTSTSETQSESRSGLAEDFCKVAVYAPATSIVLTRESGLKPLTKFDFDVRARNAEHEGEWSTVSEYIGMWVRGLENETTCIYISLRSKRELLTSYGRNHLQQESLLITTRLLVALEGTFFYLHTPCDLEC